MQRVVLSFLVAFVLLMIVIVLSRLSFNNSQNHSNDVEASRDVIRHLNNIDVQLRSAELFSPNVEKQGHHQLYQLYKDELNRIGPNLKQLKFKVKGRPQQAAIADSLETLILALLPTLRQKSFTEILTEGDTAIIDALEKAHFLIRRGTQLEEDELAVKRKILTESNNRNSFFTLILSILAILIVSATFLGQFFLRRKSLWLESFLDSILNTTLQGIVYFKPVRNNGQLEDFAITYANQAMETLVGTEARALLGSRLSQFDPVAFKGEVFTACESVLRTGQPTAFEHLYSGTDKQQWLYLSISKMNDGLTVAFQNISALKRYETELKTNIAALEQSNHELEEYAYAASHDLQEPLRKIRTFGDFLFTTQYERMDEKGRSHLEKILQSTERMSLLIKDLLTFSSLKQKEEFEPTDLNEIFEKVLQDLEVMIAQSGAVITHDPLPEIPAIPVQINQLFYNLVNNALKFARPGLPLHLDVSCRTVTGSDVRDVPGLAPKQLYYEIIFSDNGIGFKQDYAAQIFGMFKRLNTQSTYAGSGIGLSLCKKVVTNHDGIIVANGKENVGAQFYIYLPVPPASS